MSILLANGGRLESGGSTASPWPRDRPSLPVRTRFKVVEVMAARKLPIILAVLLVVSVGLTAARVGVAPAQAATGDSVVVAWNQQVLNAIKETKTGPTIAARALAVVHTAIYDAWAAYDPVAVDSRQRLRINPGLRQAAAERTQVNKERAVSFAAYAALVDLFPGQDQQNAFATQMGDLHYAIDGSDLSPAAEVGRTAAQAVLAFRHQDGANQLNNYADYTGYAPKNNWNTPADQIDPDHWQPLCVLTDAGVKNGIPPTPPAGNNCEAPYYKIQTYLTPFWAKVKPFALTKPDQFRPPGPYTYLGSDGKPSGQYVGQIDKMTQYSKQLDDFRKTTRVLG